MPQKLDATRAEELIYDLDSHFADQRRYLMPPYLPTGALGLSNYEQTLNGAGFQKIADEMRLYLGLSREVLKLMI
jgi:hypothetical protein